jgi:hypothetical protein
MIVFIPCGSTAICATPVGDPPRRRTPATSTPSAASASVSRVPSGSSPTHPTIVTPTPWRAAETAWLAPLPPSDWP